MDVPSTERTDWLTADEGDPGYREFSKEEIVSIVSKGSKEEEDDDNKEDPPTVSHASACQALLQTVVTYLEQHPVVPMSTMVILNGLTLGDS